MNKFFFRRQASGAQQPPRIFAGLQFFHDFLNWLTALVRVTEEEQRDAGVCVGDQRYDR